MAFKPNYNQQRADRNRAKAQKKQEKLKRLEEETAKRKAARGDEPGDRKTSRGRLGDSQSWPRNSKPARTASCLFDVFYEDGTQTSNRKVPAAELGGLDGDAPARSIRRSAGPGNRRHIRPAARPHQVDQPLAQGLSLDYRAEPVGTARSRPECERDAQFPAG